MTLTPAIAPVRHAFTALLLASALGGCFGEPVDPQADVGDTADAATGDAAQAVQPVTLYPNVCGLAGTPCCYNNVCGAGLVCNDAGICRTPCGALNQRCCLNQTCDQGLTCAPGSTTCRPAPPPPPPDPVCVPCANRTCGLDTSCGPTMTVNCGACGTGFTCNATGSCVSTSGGGGGGGTGGVSPCGGPCPRGQSCIEDFFGSYCGFQL